MVIDAERRGQARDSSSYRWWLADEDAAFKPFQARFTRLSPRVERDSGCMTMAETDWSRLNRAVEQMTTRLAAGHFEESFQSIGHLARVPALTQAKNLLRNPQRALPDQFHRRLCPLPCVRPYIEKSEQL